MQDILFVKDPIVVCRDMCEQVTKALRGVGMSGVRTVACNSLNRAHTHLGHENADFAAVVTAPQLAVGATGQDLVRLIRRTPGYADLPIIFYTKEQVDLDGLDVLHVRPDGENGFELLFDALRNLLSPAPA